MSGRSGSCRPWALASIIALFWVALPGAAATARDPHDWLEQMGQAVEHLNYEGTLVHVTGDESTVLSIVHRARDGHITERITTANGGREIIRTDDQVTCIFPDQRAVLVEPRDESTDSRSPLRLRLPGTGINSAHYHVAFSERDRVAGREAQGIVIRPMDGFRYGYRIWLDRATVMPLKSQLVDENGAILEQVLFTQITLSSRIPDSALKPSTAIESFAVRRSMPAQAQAADRAAAPDWVAGEIPPGFALTVHQAKVSPDSDRGLRHMVYSDGLATVSLFIEPAVAAAEQAEGLSQIGAASAYTAIVDGYMVTAIGEVPVRTVKVLAQSARPVVSQSRH